MRTSSARSLPVVAACRVILDNDWAGDPDGLVALAHHLLSPANRVVLITSSLLNPAFGVADGASTGAGLADELVTLIDPPIRPPVIAGPEEPSATETPSPAAQAIIAEARRDDPLPLLLVCAGPLTNVAAALRAAPEVADRFALVWVGGSVGDVPFEYNRDTDRAAAQLVEQTPGLRITQFPLEAYERCAYSVAELEHDLCETGSIGRWLWRRFLDLQMPAAVRLGGTWVLGDSPPLLLTALTDTSSTWTSSAGGPGRRRVCTDIDFRLLVGDLLARLRLHELESVRPDP